jgi:DNA primase
MALLSREFIDYVIDSTNFLDILEYYSIAPGNMNKKNEIKIKCPFHEDNNPSCGISIDKKVYHCWSCGASGNIVDFIMNEKPYLESPVAYLVFPRAIKLMASISDIKEMKEADVIDISIDNFYRKMKNEEREESVYQKIVNMNYIISKFLGDYLFENPDKINKIQKLYESLDKYIDEENLDKIKELWSNLPEKIND